MLTSQLPSVSQMKIIGPNIGYIRPEVLQAMLKWQVVADCLAGQAQIKQRGTTYLPMPNAADQSDANQKRYANYVVRAVFYGVTKRTIQGMISQVFSRDPIVSVPDRMKSLTENLDGTGVTLDQSSKMALTGLMAYGRGGLLVDYPNVSGPVTIAEQAKGLIRPTIIRYEPTQIINWRYRVSGSVSQLELVVLHEKKSISDDGFTQREIDQWRILQLDPEGNYTETVYAFDDPSHTFQPIEGPFKPKKSDGTPWTEIPFIFMGVDKNNAFIDDAPAYDLAVLNIAHYRNSADYEDSCYMVGQPTPYFAGLTQQWVDQVFKGTIQLGSRSAIPLPQGGTAGLLQVDPNSMPMEAMKHKEAQMVALGAKLITSASVQKTLGEAQLDESTESSILSTATKNVASAYTKALKWAALFFGAQETEVQDVQYSLNTDFPASRLSPNDRNELMLEWQSGAITWTEMRAGLRRAGVATEDDAAAKTDIKENPPPPPADNAGFVQNKGKGGDPTKVQNTPPDPGNNGGNQAGN